jgi:hypothetical protein
MAKPSAKLPQRSVDVVCVACQARLFRYKKDGKGALTKCWVARVVEDYTEGDLKCPGCGVEFARQAMIRGTPAYKIIGRRAVVRR